MFTSSLEFDKEENEKNFFILEETISQFNNNCCAFIGAGLSLPLDYPSWENLISDFEKYSKSEHTDFVPIQENSLLLRAQACKDILSVEEYERFLLAQFVIRSDPYRPIHEFLLKLPFRAYITTNFDNCLERAASYNLNPVPKVFTYPLNLKPTFLSDKNIFHLHGIIDPDHHDVNFSNDLVFTYNDFQMAYEENGEIENFLENVLSSHPTIFLGFNIHEEYFKRLFNKIMNIRKSKIKVATEKGLEVGKWTHFIFLEYPRNSILTSNLDLIQNKVKNENFDLTEMNILPIRYIASNKYHPELGTFLHLLLTRRVPASFNELSSALI